MKKYRPIKLWIILSVLIFVGVLLGGFLIDGWKRIIILICTGAIILVFILSLTYFLQFYDDKIVIRHGLFSFSKSYRSNLKTRNILFDDIRNISLNYSSKYVIINMKDDSNIMLSLNGYLYAYKIIDEFKNVNNKIQK